MQVKWNRKSGHTETVRMPSVAGTFYASSSAALSGQVQGFIDQAAPKTSDGKLVGIIVPHAGYLYSGPVAGHAYKLLREREFDTVVLVGLSHRHPVQGAAIYAHGSFRTPLGDIEIDEELAAQIMALSNKVIDLPAAHAQEHSLEVQLPFLQKSLQNFRIVPILLQDDSPENVNRLSQAIAQAIGDRSILLLGSTDLCHYPEYKEAVKSDRVVVEAIQQFDTDYLRNQMDEYMQAHFHVPELHCMMCSTGAVYTTIEAAKQLGANRLEVVKAANSGDVPMGAGDRVVGYMAAAIYG